MAGAICFVHLAGGFFAPKGYEYALTLLVANVGVAIAGAGVCAIDNLFSKPKAA